MAVQGRGPAPAYAAPRLVRDFGEIGGCSALREPSLELLTGRKSGCRDGCSFVSIRFAERMVVIRSTTQLPQGQTEWRP